MRHITEAFSVQLPNEFSESFAPALSQLHSSLCDVVGSLADTILSSDQAENVLPIHNGQLHLTQWSHHRSKYFINSTSHDYLQVLYSKLYNSPIRADQIYLGSHDQPEIIRAARIDSIILHTVTIDEKVYSHLLVSLSRCAFCDKVERRLIYWSLLKS